MNFKQKEKYTSENLWEKVNLLTEDQISTLARGLAWTFNNMPDAVLVGGTATVNYVVNDRELTPDFDFLVKDISAIKDRLNDEGIKYDPLTIGIGDPLGIVVKTFNCDYLECNVGNKKLNEFILRTFNIAIIGGFEVKVINPELLAIMKLELGRERDLNDAFAILASGKCDRERYKTYLMKLKINLQDFDSIWSYNELIK